MRLKSLFTKSSSNLAAHNKPSGLEPSEHPIDQPLASQVPDLPILSSNAELKDPSSDSYHDNQYLYSNTQATQDSQNSLSSSASPNLANGTFPASPSANGSASSRTPNPDLRSQNTLYANQLTGDTEKMRPLKDSTSTAPKPTDFTGFQMHNQPIRDQNNIPNNNSTLSPNPNAANGPSPNMATKSTQLPSPNSRPSSHQSMQPSATTSRNGLDPSGNPLLQPPRAFNKRPESRNSAPQPNSSSINGPTPDQRVLYARRSQPIMNGHQPSRQRQQPTRSPQIPEHSLPPRSASVNSFSRPFPGQNSRDRLRSIDLLDVADVPVMQSRLKIQNSMMTTPQRVQSPAPSFLSNQRVQSPIPNIPGIGPAPSRSRFQQQSKQRLPSASQITEFNDIQSISSTHTVPRAASRQSVILFENQVDNHLAGPSNISLDSLIPAINSSKFAPPGSRSHSMRSASYTSLRNSKLATPKLSNDDSDSRNSQHRFTSPARYASPSSSQHQLGSKNRSKSALDLRSSAMPSSANRPSLPPTMEYDDQLSPPAQNSPQIAQVPEQPAQKGKKVPPPLQIVQNGADSPRLKKLATFSSPTLRSFDENGNNPQNGQNGHSHNPANGHSYNPANGNSHNPANGHSHNPANGHNGPNPANGHNGPNPPNGTAHPPIPSVPSIPVAQGFMEPPPKSPSRKNFPLSLQLYPDQQGPDNFKPSPTARKFEQIQPPRSPGSPKSSASNSTYGPVAGTNGTSPNSAVPATLQTYQKPLENGPSPLHLEETGSAVQDHQPAFDSHSQALDEPKNQHASQMDQYQQPVSEPNGYSFQPNGTANHDKAFKLEPTAETQPKLQPAILPNTQQNFSQETTPTVTILGSLDSEPRLTEAAVITASDQKAAPQKHKRRYFGLRGLGSESTPNLAFIAKDSSKPSTNNIATSASTNNLLSVIQRSPKASSRTANQAQGSPVLQRSSSTRDRSSSSCDASYLPQINEGTNEPPSLLVNGISSAPKSPERQRSSWRRKSSLRSNSSRNDVSLLSAPSSELSRNPSTASSRKEPVVAAKKPEGPLTKNRFHEIFKTGQYSQIVEQWTFLQRNLESILNDHDSGSSEKEGYDAVFCSITSSLNTLSPLLRLSLTEWGLMTYIQSEIIRKKGEFVKNIRMTNGYYRAQETKEKEEELLWVDKGVGLISSIQQTSPQLFTVPSSGESKGNVDYPSLDPNAVSQPRSAPPKEKQAPVSKYPAPPTIDHLMKAMPDSTCPVCMESFTASSQVIVLPCCLHVFHASPCLFEWVTAPKHKRRRGRDRAYEARMHEYTEDLSLDLARIRGTMSRRQLKHEAHVYEFTADRAILREVKTGLEGRPKTIKKKQSKLGVLNKGGLIAGPGESSFTAKSFAKSFMLVKRRLKEGSSSTQADDAGTGSVDMDGSGDVNGSAAVDEPSPFIPLPVKTLLDTRLARKIDRCAVTMDGMGDDESLVDDSDPARNMTLTNGCPLCRATFDAYM